MESNTKEFNMEQYNDFLKSIKAGSPVHKINFTLECPNAVVGMYLMTIDNTKEYLDKIVDREDLNDNTLLVFESRHVVECCQIIYGCLNLLKNINMYRMKYEVFIDMVIDTLLTKPSYYKNIDKELINLTYNCIHIDIDKREEASLFYNKFFNIMRSIWFIPYGKIDETAKEAIEVFQKRCEEGENHE